MHTSLDFAAAASGSALFNQRDAAHPGQHGAIGSVSSLGQFWSGETTPSSPPSSLAGRLPLQPPGEFLSLPVRWKSAFTSSSALRSSSGRRPGELMLRARSGPPPASSPAARLCEGQQRQDLPQRPRPLPLRSAAVHRPRRVGRAEGVCLRLRGPGSDFRSRTTRIWRRQKATPCQRRAAGHRAHRLRGADPDREGRRALGRLPGQPQPRALGPRQGDLDPDARDRQQRRPLHPRRDGRPGRPDEPLLPRVPRHPAAQPSG